jgi:hypothetical protein
MGPRLPLSVRVERLAKFVDYLRAGNAVKDATNKSTVPTNTLRIFVEQGFIQTTGHRSSLKVIKIADLDSESLQLMAEAVWGEEKNSKPSLTSQAVRQLPPTMDLPPTPFLPHTLLEKVSHHTGVIATELSLQCSGKTPPGMAQLIVKLQMENGELKKKLYKRDQEFDELSKQLRKVAQSMRDQAGKFEIVGSKITSTN